MDEATEEWNAMIARDYALSKETPARKWFYADALHPAIFRALKIDREEAGAAYAVAPFRLYRDEAGARILLPIPCPPQFDERGDDWLSVECVLEWWPHHNTMAIMGDDGEHSLIGRIGEDQCQIFADPFAFVRALAEARAQWFVSWAINNGDWRRKPLEPDHTPGLFLFGSPDNVRWPSHAMPDDVVCIGTDAQAINRAMLRQAKIPRVRASHQFEKKAA